MTMEQIISFLEKHAEPEYAAFSASLLNDTIAAFAEVCPSVGKGGSLASSLGRRYGPQF